MTEPNRPGMGSYTADFELIQRGAPPRKLLMTELLPPHAPAPITFIEQTHVTTGFMNDGSIKGCTMMLYTPDKPIGFMLVMDAETARDIMGFLERVAGQLEAEAATAAADMLGQLRSGKDGAA
jgi:hypothetical protein